MLLKQQHLISQRDSSNMSLYGREAETLITSNLYSTPYMDIGKSSGANKKMEANMGLNYNEVDQGMEELDHDRSISLRSRLCYQDDFYVDASPVVAVDGEKTCPQLHEVQSFPSLSDDEGYQDKRVRFQYKTSHVPKFMVAKMKPTTTHLVPDKRQFMFANEKILGVSAIGTSIANQNGDSRGGNREKQLNVDIIEDSDVGNTPESMAGSSQLVLLQNSNLKESEALLSTWTMESRDADSHITVSEVDTMSTSPRTISTSINQDTPLPSSTTPRLVGTTPRPVSTSINQDTPLHSLRKYQPRLCLGLDDLQGPRVLSSSHLGSIVSADQSTTISCVISDHSGMPSKFSDGFSKFSAASPKYSAAFLKSSSSFSRGSTTSLSRTTVTNTCGGPIRS